ncbi:MASE3 domain-containing protein [Methanofollis fontis]|uniref:histidine kinase n=1 Tax=Methanofollis fontis TaxID=2052832 RepID=A0A483CZB9_9EURY|nr:MASE3 domain-containing protein [Methanofollis fontis]TAJ45409.1 histidine kinase [Methanofollis fontis]
MTAASPPLPSGNDAGDRLFFGVLCLFLALTALTSLYSYLLFHTLAELFSILIAGAIFIIAWNSRAYIDNTYLLFIGVAYLFIGGIDLVHTLAYAGMNIFVGYDANLPTQLWIAARYLESVTLVTAALLFGRWVRPGIEFLVYAAVSLLLLVLIFAGLFPDCYIVGSGLTPFKVGSEYLISALFALSALLLWRHRSAFEPRVFSLVLLAIGFSIAAELAFTFYVSVYGFSNLVGHLCKIVSFALIYQGVVVTGLRRPYQVIFRDLAEREREVREERNRLGQYLSVSGVIFLVLDREGRVRLVNRRACEILGYAGEEMVGADWFERFLPPEGREEMRTLFFRLMAGDGAAGQEVEGRVITAGGEERQILWHTALLRDESGAVTGTLSLGEDITERKRAAAALERANQKLNILNSITRHDIMNEVTAAVMYLELIADSPEEKRTLYLENLGALLSGIRQDIEFSRDYQDMGVKQPLWQSPGEIIQRYARSSPQFAGVAVTADLEGVQVYADPMLPRVFSNLMDNAVIHGGHVTSIRFSAEAGEDGALSIVCQDDGEGVAEEEKGLIFRQGYGRNHGLGLYLVQEILAITGAAIEECGTPGEGARFVIRVPPGYFRRGAEG